jgi:hypothetical protein
MIKQALPDRDESGRVRPDWRPRAAASAPCWPRPVVAVQRSGVATKQGGAGDELFAEEFALFGNAGAVEADGRHDR